jgi:hypothetical protein
VPLGFSDTRTSTSDDAIVELCQRYMRRELSLEAAGSQLYDLIRAGLRGLSIDAIHLAASDHQRAFALLGYTIWRAYQDMGIPTPKPATEAEFAARATVAPDEP